MSETLELDSFAEMEIENADLRRQLAEARAEIRTRRLGYEILHKEYKALEGVAAVVRDALEGDLALKWLTYMPIVKAAIATAIDAARKEAADATD